MRKALIETIRATLIDALHYHGGSVNLAACELMIGRVTLYRKIKELNPRIRAIRSKRVARELFEKKRAIGAVQNGRH